MPTGDEDPQRRDKWRNKAALKQRHIAKHKQKMNELKFDMQTENKEKQKETEKEKEKEENNDDEQYVTLKKLKQYVNQGQQALGAFNTEVKIVPSLLENEEHMSPEAVPMKDNVEQNNQNLKPKLTKSREKALAAWNTRKMNSRKDQLTRLMITVICIVVIIFALVAMSILSWWSHGNTTNNAPPLPHTILF